MSLIRISTTPIVEQCDTPNVACKNNSNSDKEMSSTHCNSPNESKYKSIQLLKVKDKSKNIQKTSSGDKLYKCKFCDCKYIKSQALGGHVSKSHSEMSSIYQQKILKR